MPVVLIFHMGKASDPKIIGKLRERLPEILADALTTSANKVSKESINLIFMKRSRHDVGKDLIILPLANDFPERKKNVDVRSRFISEKVDYLLAPLLRKDGEKIHGFTYVFLGSGGLGVFSP